MRFDIDQQDLVNLANDTRRGFDRARRGLILSLSLLALAAAGAVYQVYRAGAVILTAAPAISPAGLISAYRHAPGVYYSGLAWIGLIAACAFLAAAILKARRKREATRKQEILANTIAAGRFDYSLALDQLIINSPLVAKKISWSRIERIEKKKSSIIFHRKDGQLEFIPRNVLPKQGFYAQLMAKHGKRLGKPCPFEEANNAKPLSITFEATRADADEYFSHYFRRRDGRLNIFRRFCQWRPWAPVLFTVFAALFAASAFAAFRAQELVFAAMSIVFGSGAAAIFVTNSGYFRGAAFPFRKDKNWPFAQTDLVTVTLSRNGVHHVRHGLSELIQWPAFERYLETRLYGYLVLSAKTVIPLPKRAFLSKPHYEKFAAFARRAIAEAKHARREETRGRMMRTIGKTEAVATAPKTNAKIAVRPVTPSSPAAKPARKHVAAKPAAPSKSDPNAANKTAARPAPAGQAMRPQPAKVAAPSKTAAPKPAAPKSAVQRQVPRKPDAGKPAQTTKPAASAQTASPAKPTPVSTRAAAQRATRKKAAAQ